MQLPGLLRWAYVWDTDVHFLDCMGARRKGWQWETWRGTERCGGAKLFRLWEKEMSLLGFVLSHKLHLPHTSSRLLEDITHLLLKHLKNSALYHPHNGPPACCSLRSLHKTQFSHTPTQHSKQRTFSPSNTKTVIPTVWIVLPTSRRTSATGDVPVAFARMDSRCWGDGAKADKVWTGAVLHWKALGSAVGSSF